MSKKFSVPIILYSPHTPEGCQKLAYKTAAVHAEIVDRYLQNLNCSEKQKRILSEAIIRQNQNRTKHT